MPAIGITGGISTGKSTFCDCLREILPGAKFFDADAVARHLVDLAGVTQELLATFGFGILSRNGDLNRNGGPAVIVQAARSEGRRAWIGGTSFDSRSWRTKRL